MFMMVMGTPAWAATGTSEAAGNTSSVEPITQNSSASQARFIDVSMAPSGSISPK